MYLVRISEDIDLGGSSVFDFQVCKSANKSANMIKQFFSLNNSIWVSNNAEFDADFESVEQAISKKLSEKWNFWLLLVCAKVFRL